VPEMILSLKTTSYTAAIFVALILGFLLLLGSRQYRSHKEYENIIEKNEKLIFQFATIREHINESLLESRHQQLNSISNEIENLNVNISQILQQPIIPDEYRLSLVSQVDFAGIILLLRNIGAGDLTRANIRQLNQEVRILGERLMLFDRIIVEHVKKKLVGFQNIVIGLLAIILFIVIYILLFWHGQIAMPLMELVKQTKEITSGKRSVISVRKKKGEVAKLACSFQNILQNQHKTKSEFSHYTKVLQTVHNVGDAVWQAQTKDAVFAEACRGVLTNNNYVLAWIGVPEDDNQILPIIADGSTTMNRQECDECMTAFITAAEENSEKYDAAQLSLKQKAPVILRDILKGLPKGPFKNTPFASNITDCIAIPLVYDQQVFGVMTIYSIAPLSFAQEEVELLKGMGREIVFAIFALTAKESNKTLSRLQTIRKKVFEETSNLILVVKADGTVIEANPAAVEKLGQDSDKINGTNIYDIFSSTSSTPENFLDTYNNDSKYIALECTGSGREYLVNLSPMTNQDDEKTFLFIAKDNSKQKAHRTETIKASRLAALGELSVGVANEINNLTNGLINYTQILSEEIGETAGNNNQSVELLKNVIKDGERISQIVKQLLSLNSNQTQTKETVKINKIIEDSLALLMQQFRYDAIDVSIKFPKVVPSVQVNVREMQHIFLNILSNARYALNQRYSGRNHKKSIEIKGDIITQNGHPRLQVVCRDYGVGIHPNIIDKVFEPFFSTKPEGIGTGLGLSICRNIIEDYNGTLNIESILDSHTTIIMDLPVV
jgi:PAS domain S-box-containing protein